jgi:triosephosphate isomerase (TIM)
VRKPIIGGNWKMHLGTPNEAISLIKSLKSLIKGIKNVDIVIAPPFTVLESVVRELKKTDISVSAQNMYFEDKGAFTGEISPLFLKSMGVKYVILGHSERRQIFGETDDLINKKIKKALKESLIPIVCIGENLNAREAGKTKEIIRNQMNFTFQDLIGQDMIKIIIAYEPIWAIGTGKTATPKQAEEIHIFIRDILKEKYGENVADEIRIQYGGSIKPNNAKSLFSRENIDGGLVGGASLNSESFYEIIEAAEKNT